MKTAVVYARVSTQRQADEGVSMEAQIEQCTARASKLGADVVRVFRDDGVSGKSTRGRTGFTAAVEYCATAGVDYFVTWSTSRFARNAVDLFMFQDALKDGGTKLECLNADIDDDTDAGFVNRMFFGTMDQMMSRQIARDTLRSQKRTAAEGYFTGGRVPYGYEAVAAAGGKRRQLQPHPDDAAIVRRLFQLCLDHGLGAQTIALRMNEAGLLRFGKPWGKNSVHYILRNEIYTGLKTFNKTNSRTGKQKPRDQWIQVVSHEALVSRADFERANSMIIERTPHEHGGTVRSTFVFSGLLQCGVCSDSLQIYNGTGRSGAVYSYYGCLAHKKGAPRCLFRGMRADLFDVWLTDVVLDRVLTPPVLAKTLEEIYADSVNWAQEREARRAILVKDRRSREGKREKLFDVLEEHGRDPADCKDLLERARGHSEAIAAIDKELERIENIRTPKRQPKIDMDVAAEVMREVVTTGDPKKKRAFMGAFIKSVTVSTKEVEIEYRPDALLQTSAETGVHSIQNWLPLERLLRTARVKVNRPSNFTNEEEMRSHFGMELLH